MNKIPIINQIIKDKKKELKINQVEFSEILQKSLSTIKRYDSGFPIPLDTLKIICDKLGLNLRDLFIQQVEENKKDNTAYYSDLINKEKKLELKISLTAENIYKIVATEKKLSYLFSAYHLKENDLDNEIKLNIGHFANGDKYHIKNDKEETLYIFTDEQASELIEHIEGYIDYFIFKCQKENLKK